jgi:hypothetical protein
VVELVRVATWISGDNNDPREKLDCKSSHLGNNRLQLRIGSLTIHVSRVRFLNRTLVY